MIWPCATAVEKPRAWRREIASVSKFAKKTVVVLPAVLRRTQSAGGRSKQRGVRLAASGKGEGNNKWGNGSYCVDVSRTLLVWP